MSLVWIFGKYYYYFSQCSNKCESCFVFFLNVY